MNMDNYNEIMSMVIDILEMNYGIKLLRRFIEYANGNIHSYTNIFNSKGIAVKGVESAFTDTVMEYTLDSKNNITRCSFEGGIKFEKLYKYDEHDRLHRSITMHHDIEEVTTAVYVYPSGSTELLSIWYSITNDESWPAYCLSMVCDIKQTSPEMKATVTVVDWYKYRGNHTSCSYDICLKWSDASSPDSISISWHDENLLELNFSRKEQEYSTIFDGKGFAIIDESKCPIGYKLIRFKEEETKNEK